jgi:hypothetical protein
MRDGDYPRQAMSGYCIESQVAGDCCLRCNIDTFLAGLRFVIRSNEEVISLYYNLYSISDGLCRLMNTTLPMFVAR